jgi:hypothetical protein
MARSNFRNLPDAGYTTARGRECLALMQESHQALWWIPEGHIPSVEVAKEKLEYLQDNGPSDIAFTFANSFEPHG